ncbi:short-chain dehydrogenase [Hypericibacter adhaerens]|uniref:Short-chain dehydrogenase n=1 Tax=Hypericibacter adhaerens TaxID=2602016 RepID=A0A5J6N214_9PROT|nr:glucose 1-dehydrogenase [Hypericibacter adhaerens]QEX23547.1 short-chain dehydrogenase [Hypericibacter adhaerens]
MARLQDKIAIVTGGSRGIGRAIVERFLAEGARVATTSQSEPKTPFPADERLVWLQADMSRADDVERLFAAAGDRFGGVDILVNNAGLQLERTIEQTSEAEWDRVMAVNLKSVFLCSRAAIPAFRRRGGGVIVNIGSYDGFVADPNLAAYCASKGGVHALTRAVAVDHGKDRIRCNAICPGWIETDMLEAYYRSLPDPAEARRRIGAIHPAGHTGKPVDIAALALWLASDEAAFVTGQLFTADGGLTAQAPQPR